jgi:NhaP-type Na+/H+ or K+/H+ antiporter
MNVRPLLAATVLQSALAAFVVARGTLSFAPSALAGAGGALAGAVLGYGLYRLLAGRIRATREPAAGSTLFTLALAYVAISIAEEILWRGWAFDRLAARGAVTALIVTTAGFAAAHAVHQGFGGVRQHALTGLAFGLVLLIAGSLVAAIAAHVTYNLAVLLSTVSIRKKARHDRLALG